MAFIDTISSVPSRPTSSFEGARQILRIRKLFQRLQTFLSAFAINLFHWKLFPIALYYHVHFHFRPKIFSPLHFSSFFLQRSRRISPLPLDDSSLSQPHSSNSVFSISLGVQTKVEEEISCGHFLLGISHRMRCIIGDTLDWECKGGKGGEREKETRKLLNSAPSKYINRCPWIFTF